MNTNTATNWWIPMQLPVLPYHTGNNYLPFSVIPWPPKLLSAFLHSLWSHFSENHILNTFNLNKTSTPWYSSKQIFCYIFLNCCLPLFIINSLPEHLLCDLPVCGALVPLTWSQVDPTSWCSRCSWGRTSSSQAAQLKHNIEILQHCLTAVWS